MRCDADLIRARIAVVADHRPHRVGAVSWVSRVARIRSRAFAERIPPVVVVVEVAAAQVPAVLADERLVRVADTRVDARDDDALAAVVERRPDLRRVDRVQAPLRSRRPSGARRNARLLRDRVGVIRADLLDVRAGRERVDDRRAGRLHEDRVDDPVRLVLHSVRVEPRADRRLALARVRGQALVDDLAATAAVVDRGRRRDVRVAVQHDPERRVPGPRELLRDLGLDRSLVRARLSAGCRQ